MEVKPPLDGIAEELDEINPIDEFIWRPAMLPGCIGADKEAPSGAFMAELWRSNAACWAGGRELPCWRGASAGAVLTEMGVV